MPQKIGPSAAKAQAMTALLPGQTTAERGEAFLRTFVQRATARGLQEALARKQPEALGRQRSERHGAVPG
jgi:hypothetical protein